jgi:hypothetical protein
VVDADTAAIRSRSRGGSACSTLSSAPEAASSDSTCAAYRSPTTAATASSSVNVSGGIARPATSR